MVACLKSLSDVARKRWTGALQDNLAGRAVNIGRVTPFGRRRLTRLAWAEATCRPPGRSLDAIAWARSLQGSADDRPWVSELRQMTYVFARLRGYAEMPWRRASRTMSTRSFAPSLVRMCEMWVCTVRRERNMPRAMSGVDAPPVTMVAILSSVGVSAVQPEVARTPRRPRTPRLMP